MHRRESIVKIHIVQKGDTLWEIAKKYGVNFEELKSLNSQLTNTDMIMPGMKIKVPTLGGSIKKEAPQMGTKKEMPITMEPIVKEAPKKEMPVKETPKKEIPKKEVPKEKPFTPKMPTPIIPEIDVTNYYSMNMTNVDVDIDVEMKEKPAPVKPAPVKPAPVKPAPVKPAPTKPVPPKLAPVLPNQEPIQKDVCPPIVPYQPYCYEVSPMMPGSGFPPGVCPPEGVPVEQIASQVYPTFPGVEYTEKHHWEESSSSYSAFINQAPSHVNHAPQQNNQKPWVQYSQMPKENLHHIVEEPFSHVAGAAHKANAPTHTAVHPTITLPVKEDCGCGGPAFPPASNFQVEGMMQGAASGKGGMPQGFGPEMGGHPMGGGFNPGMGGMPQGFGPEMGGHPMAGGFNPGMDMRGIPQGFSPELGGHPMAGVFNPGMGGMSQGFGPEMGSYPIGYNQSSINQSPYPQDAVGNTPNSYSTENNGPVQEAPSYEGPITSEVASPAYGPGGNAPVFTPPYNPTIGQPPFMNPYGMNQGTPFGMPRYQEDESSDL
ncbi:SafA/ExsA family spore coat assembly protein [Bacillus circulans]|nr:SafA/ExsA family spore coat assembly protein [Niallia circulans]